MVHLRVIGSVVLLGLSPLLFAARLEALAKGTGTVDSFVPSGPYVAEPRRSEALEFVHGVRVLMGEITERLQRRVNDGDVRREALAVLSRRCEAIEVTLRQIERSNVASALQQRQIRQALVALLQIDASFRTTARASR